MPRPEHNKNGKKGGVKTVYRKIKRNDNGEITFAIF